MNQIILASTSPRRYQLLHSLGFEINIMDPNVDETPLKFEEPTQMVMRLAKLKANAISTTLDWPIIAADTIVCLGTKVFGKPKNLLEAKEILSLLSGKEHQVITGYTIKKGLIEITDFVATIVSFRQLTDEQIEAYVQTGEPLDKAGAYAIQGIGAFLVDHIQGSYTGVIGLPVTEVLAALSKIV